MEQNSTNWLAELLTKQREIIEAAETPFAKLAVFILPILSPIVPAFMSGVHLYTLFLKIFTFEGAGWVSRIMSLIIALVLELLGYVGAIASIKALFTWTKDNTTGNLVRAIVNAVAYLFYLLAIVLVNFFLGRYLGEDTLVTIIVGLLSLITVPTGLLAANHLSDSAEQEKEDKLRKEQYEREDKLRREKDEVKLERYRIKHGVSNTSRNNTEVPNDFQKSFGSDSKMGRPSIHQERVFSYLEENYIKNGVVPTFTEVVKNLNLPEATVSRLRKSWLEMKRNGK